MSRILITGAKGLLGHHLSQALSQKGFEVVGLDAGFPVDHASWGDIVDRDRLRSLADGCQGIVHLAAVSRVIWGEQDPEKCRQVNIAGTENVLQVAREIDSRPWVLYASSREVYGQQDKLPVQEDAALQPLNVYAHTKVTAERLVREGREQGLKTAIVRYSSVYGSIQDHSDRVLPAFCRAAVCGENLRIEGLQNLFDFTYIEDAVAGTIALIQRLEQGDLSLPPIHLTTGKGTTLLEAAEMAIAAAHSSSQIREAPPRSYDVARFVGDPARANQLLHWKARVSLEDGIQRLVTAFQQERATS